MYAYIYIYIYIYIHICLREITDALRATKQKINSHIGGPPERTNPQERHHNYARLGASPHSRDAHEGAAVACGGGTWDACRHRGRASRCPPRSVTGAPRL